MASNAGLGWQQAFQGLKQLTSTSDFDSALAWCEANSDRVAGSYPFSKQLINAMLTGQLETKLMK